MGAGTWGRGGRAQLLFLTEITGERTHTSQLARLNHNAALPGREPAEPHPSHLVGTVGEPERWKWTFCHLPSRRCQTRVSSACAVRGFPEESRYWVRRT